MCIGSSNYPKEENVDCLLRCWDLWIGQHVIWYCTLYFVLENRIVVIVHKLHSRINMWLLTKGLLQRLCHIASCRSEIQIVLSIQIMYVLIRNDTLK